MNSTVTPLFLSLLNLYSSFSAIGRDSIFPSVQEGHSVKVESGERHEAHQKHDRHIRKDTSSEIL